MSSPQSPVRHHRTRTIDTIDAFGALRMDSPPTIPSAYGHGSGSSVPSFNAAYAAPAFTPARQEEIAAAMYAPHASSSSSAIERKETKNPMASVPLHRRPRPAPTEPRLNDDDELILPDGSVHPKTQNGHYTSDYSSLNYYLFMAEQEVKEDRLELQQIKGFMAQQTATISALHNRIAELMATPVVPANVQTLLNQITALQTRLRNSVEFSFDLNDPRYIKLYNDTEKRWEKAAHPKTGTLAWTPRQNGILQEAAEKSWGIAEAEKSVVKGAIRNWQMYAMEADCHQCFHDWHSNALDAVVPDAAETKDKADKKKEADDYSQARPGLKRAKFWNASKAPPTDAPPAASSSSSAPPHVDRVPMNENAD